MGIITASPKLVKGTGKMLLITVAYGNIAGDGLMKLRCFNTVPLHSREHFR